MVLQYIKLQNSLTHLLEGATTWAQDDEGDMVERGLILAAIVVAAVFLWFNIGDALADNLSTVESVIP